jgi:hypothetical protein
MSGYRELERQLRESVRRRATSSRRRVARRLTLALVPLVLAGGVAAGATQLTHRPKLSERARKLAFQAVSEVAAPTPGSPGPRRRASRCAPCAPGTACAAASRSTTASSPSRCRGTPARWSWPSAPPTAVC